MLDKLIIYKTSDKIYTIAYNQEHKLEYFFSEPLALSVVNAIFLAKVTHVNLHSHLAFVEYNENCSGIINLDKSDKVQCGSKLLCQMVWVGNEEKQAKLTTSINLAGKYVVLLLNSKQHHFAKNLRERDKLQLLSQKYGGYGLIFRSAINIISNLDLVSKEIEYLLNKQQLTLKTVATSKASAEMILPGESKYQLLLKNMSYTDSFSISTNCETVFNCLSKYVDLWTIDELNLDTTLDVDINGLLQQVNTVATHTSGIQIKIHKLSGINLIDVDSNNAKLDFFQVNYLVIDLIAQQIKLHDLTGIILIDFIKNMSISEQQKLGSGLFTHLANDWRKNTLLGFTKAGLYEIIRNK